MEEEITQGELRRLTQAELNEQRDKILNNSEYQVPPDIGSLDRDRLAGSIGMDKFRRKTKGEPIEPSYYEEALKRVAPAVSGGRRSNRKRTRRRSNRRRQRRTRK